MNVGIGRSLKMRKNSIAFTSTSCRRTYGRTESPWRAHDLRIPGAETRAKSITSVVRATAFAGEFKRQRGRQYAELHPLNKIARTEQVAEAVL